MKTFIKSLSIKLASISMLFCLISSPSFSQSLSRLSTSNINLSEDAFQTNSETEEWSSIGLSLNTGGFLVTGPVLQVDFRIAKKTYIGAYFVSHYLGMFAGTLIFDSDITAFSPKSLGAGISAKHYIKPNEKLNAWYCGMYLGYSYNEATYHSGYPNEKVERVNDLLLIGSGGYRWNFGKNFYSLVGVQLGIYYAFNDEIYSVYTLDSQSGIFIKEESLSEDYSGEIYPAFLPELTIGINF